MGKERVCKQVTVYVQSVCEQTENGEQRCRCVSQKGRGSKAWDRCVRGTSLEPEQEGLGLCEVS